MSGTKKKQMIKEQMISIYGEGCWMGYKLTPKNPYTYHHILEARKGGRVTIDNGALLTISAHRDLNAMEQNIKRLYIELNLLFKELNRTKKPPTREYFKEVNGVLLRANKVITLSHLWEPNPDFVLLEDIAQITHETYPDIIIPEKYRDRVEEEPVEISIDYRPKVKHKNRKRKSYKYYK